MTATIWHDTLAAAHEAAESDKKLLLRYFHAPG